MPIKIALFASGSGSNAENIANYYSKSTVFEFPLIISNKADAYVHERAKKLQIPSFTFSREDFLAGDKIITFLKEHNIE